MQQPLPSAEALLRDTAPRGGVPVFAGFAARRHNREEELQAAMEDAAREAVRYLEVRVSAVSISRRESGEATRAEAVRTRIDEARADDLVDRLETRARVQDERGTVVLVAAPSLGPVALPPAVDRGGLADGTDGQEAGDGTIPAWVGRPPRIPGYDVGVGLSGRRRSRGDALRAADEAALAEIVTERAARLRATEERRSTEEAAGTAERTVRLEEGVDVVRGFYILSRRRSSDGRYYYSLGIAPQSGRQE
ncbi:MAG: hypothetical protein ACOCXE_01340 [Spirochaetota bacterium]